METGSRFFEVPNDVETKIRLLFAGPSGWLFSGVMYAPESLVTAGQVSTEIGLCCERDDIIISCDGRKTKQEDYLKFVTEWKHPAYVAFTNNICDMNGRSRLTRITKEQIFAALLRKGFDGHIALELGGYENESWYTRASYDVYTKPGLGFDFNDIASKPARVRISWEGSRYCRGDEMLIAPLVAVCEELGLRELTPAVSIAA